MSKGDRRNQKGKLRVTKWLLAIALVIGLISPLAYRAYYRARCGAATMMSSSFLRTVHTYMTTYKFETGQMPGSVGLAFVDGGLRRQASKHGHYSRNKDYIFEDWCFCDTPSDVVLGGATLREIRKGAVSLEQVRANIDDLYEDGDWEQFGRFFLSHEMEAFESLSDDVIVGFSCYELEGQVICLKANAFEDWTYSRAELVEIAERDRQARLELGLNPPIDLFKEIDEFRERRGLESISN